MVFNSPTEVDLANSDRYLFERSKLLFFNYYLRLKPFIFSHTIIEIRYNRFLKKPPQFPAEFNIYVVLRSGKKFCEQVHCQSKYARGGLCTENDIPTVFKSGNTDIDACHASCFNLFDNAKDKDGVSYLAPFTRYSEKQNCCTLLNNELFALGMDDYVRTDYHLTPRIDTINTGFDLDTNPFVDDEGNETFHFKMNKYYCDEFMRKFDGGKCYTPLYEEIFGFLVSSTLYKACQYGIRYAQTGVPATGLSQPKLPPIQKENPLSYDQWLHNVDNEAFFINPHVTLLDLGMDKNNMEHLIFTTEYGWPGRLVEPLIVYKELGALHPDAKIVDFDELNKNRLIQFKYDSYGQRLMDEYEFLNVYKLINENALSNNNYIEDGEGYYSMNIFENIFSMIFNWQLPLQILVGKLQSKIVDRLTYGLIHTSELLNSKIATRFMLTLSERIMFYVIVPTFLKPIFKFIAMALKLLSATIKQLDTIINIVGLIDLFDLAFDFFKLNAEQPSESIDQYSEMDILSRKKANGYGTMEYSPLLLMGSFENIEVEKNNGTNHDTTKENTFGDKLPPPSQFCSLLKQFDQNTAKWKLKLEDVSDRYDYYAGFVWSSEYIYSMETNSNGLPINWNDDENVCKIEELDQYFDKSFKQCLQNFDTYSSFSRSFRKKVNILKFLIPASFIIVLLITFMNLLFALMFLFFVSIIIYTIVFSNILTPEKNTD